MKHQPTHSNSSHNFGRTCLIATYGKIHHPGSKGHGWLRPHACMRGKKGCTTYIQQYFNEKTTPSSRLTTKHTL